MFYKILAVIINENSEKDPYLVWMHCSATVITVVLGQSEDGDTIKTIQRLVVVMHAEILVLQMYQFAFFLFVCLFVFQFNYIILISHPYVCLHACASRVSTMHFSIYLSSVSQHKTGTCMH